MTKKKSIEWLNCSESELLANVSAWLKTVDLKNSILFLEGEMGSGKSAFVRALLQVLAPSVQTAGSPTFSLVNEYQAESGFTIYHIDLYRLKDEAELIDSGIETQIEARAALTCIEWASLFPDYFSFWWDELKNKPKNVIQIQIDYGNRSDARNYKIRLD